MSSYAAFMPRYYSAKILLVHGADVNAKNAEGHGVLRVVRMSVLRYQRAEMIDLLKRHGATR